MNYLTMKIGKCNNTPIYLSITTLIISIILYNISKNYFEFYMYAVGITFLHELGHLVFNKSGKADKILISWYGGYIKFKNYLTLPNKDKLKCSIGGLFIQFVFAIFLIPFYIFTLDQMIFNLLMTNIAILVLNLLPINPLDGGQILFYILSKWFKPDKSMFITNCITIILLISLIILSSLNLMITIMGIIGILVNLCQCYIYQKAWQRFENRICEFKQIIKKINEQYKDEKDITFSFSITIISNTKYYVDGELVIGWFRTYFPKISYEEININKHYFVLPTKSFEHPFFKEF